MLSISGIVPNGVPAAFLTAPDGTAVRADVKDNGYEFLLPNQRTPEQRYVVWTGGDGTPHVQPVVTFASVRPGACKAAAKLPASLARVSPDDLLGCMASHPAVAGRAARCGPVAPTRATTSAADRRAAPSSLPRCWRPPPAAPRFVPVPGAVRRSRRCPRAGGRWCSPPLAS